MGHAQHDNRTPFRLEPLFVADEEGRPMLVCVVKGTFDVDRTGHVRLADEQVALEVSGERWDLVPNDPDEPPSWRFEPELAWTKPATDVVFVGHAHAPDGRTSVLDVGVSVGPLTKVARVFGERVWVRAAGDVVSTRPLPFQRIPLVYERAFGGVCREGPAPAGFEVRNPAGVGFLRDGAPIRDRSPLPNIEDPRAPIRHPRERPSPICFGYTSPHWQPRAAFAGTFDAAWHAQRKPLLPRDFDRRHLCAASAGLIARGHLRGDERVSVIGLVPQGRLVFDLPGVPPPRLRVAFVSGPDRIPPMVLDTLVFDLDAGRFFVLWRADVVLARGPHDVRAIEVTSAAASAARVA